MKKNLIFIMFVPVLLLTGAGCPLSKSNTVVTVPVASNVHMQQGIPSTSSIKKTDSGIKPEVVFANTTITLASEKKSTESISLAGGLLYSLKIHSLQQEWRSPSTTVGVHIPQMTYTSKPAKAAAFNDLINIKVKQITDGFLQQVADWDDDNVPLPEQVNFIDVSVKARTANAKVLSLIFDISTYYSGSAHPNRSTMSFNYDLEKDRELILDDLFVTGKSYISKLSEITIASLRALPPDTHGAEAVETGDLELREWDLDWLKGGAGPDENNFHTVTIAPEGFYLEFDPYDIDSYAAGSTEILIPYTQLGGYVAPRVFVLVK